jgi:gluconokinase
MLRSSFWPAKLIWLKRTQPNLFKGVRLWMSPGEWLWRELTGIATCGASMASGTGLLNAETLNWDESLLLRSGVKPGNLLPLDDKPSKPEPGHLAEFPELRGLPWFPALGDGAASNLGCGATHPGLAAINVGTSAAVRIVCKGGRASAPFGLFCYRVDAQRHLIGGAVSNAGNLRAWCLRELRLSDDPAQIERMLARRPAPKHGLTILPFWSAERAPNWEEDRRGLIDGITLDTTALDLLQAITEASYFRIARVTELISAEEQQPPKLIISGGIQRSRVSLRRLANVLNAPLHPNDEPEATLKGGAVYVLEKLSFELPAFRLARPIRPDPRVAEQYARERQCQSGAELRAQAPLPR